MTTHRARIAVVSGFLLALAGRALAAPACQPRGETKSTEHRYVGAAACASQNCHGSIERRGLSQTSLQNEFIIWYQQDRHARAYTMLESELGRRIGARLRINATESTRCRACHAPDVPSDTSDCQVRLRDGVTCEACHGPAGAWLEPHTEKDWEPSCSLELGMKDMSRPEVAVEVCLDCHLGHPTDEIRRVDHDLLAAGHPPLAFEVDSFATDMPAHWARREGNEGWFDGHAWAAGQVAAARRAAVLFVDQMRDRGWPDFAAFDCQSCHHPFSRGAWAGRDSDGRPKLDGARRPGMDALVGTVATEHRAALREGTDELAKAAAAGHGGPGVAGAVGKVSAATGELLGKIPLAKLDDDHLVQLMRAIAGLAKETAGLGFRAAQQTAWALESLVDARSQLHGDTARAMYPELRAAIGRVYDGLGDPDRYDPARTERSIGAVGAAVK